MTESVLDYMTRLGRAARQASHPAAWLSARPKVAASIMREARLHSTPKAASGTVPPAAAACGITAQLENEVGVWAAPANRPVRGAFARADDAGLPEPGFLFEERIDEIRRTERGLMLLGARSTATDRDWTHLSVRRLIDWLEAQLAADLAWAPFEPNDALLWSAMASTVRRRLRALFWWPLQDVI